MPLEEVSRMFSPEGARKRPEEVTVHSGNPRGRGQVEARQRFSRAASCVVEILCRAVTLQAAALRGLVVLTWALRTSSYGGDCCSLEMAYTWLSTSYVCPVPCARFLSSTVQSAGDKQT